MSAWIVSEKHITVLVNALFKYEVATPEMGTAQEMGQVLWQENFTSVNYLYGKQEACPVYQYQPSPSLAAVVRKPIVLYKQLCCYQYQTCEHPAWERSKAHLWTETLCKVLEKRTGQSGGRMHESAEYENAPWGID